MADSKPGAQPSKITVPVDVEPDVPASKWSEIKSLFHKSGSIDQVFISSSRKEKIIYGLLFGKHTEEALCFPLPKKLKGTPVANALLETMQRAVEVLDKPFHVHHKLPGKVTSPWITFSMIEGTWRASACGKQIGHIRALAEVFPISFYDHTAATANHREMFLSESVQMPSSRFVPGTEHACVL